MNANRDSMGGGKKVPSHEMKKNSRVIQIKGKASNLPSYAQGFMEILWFLRNKRKIEGYAYISK